MAHKNNTAFDLADEVPEHLSFEEIYALLNESEKMLVIAFAEKLKEKRHTP